MDTYRPSPRREDDFQLHTCPGALSGRLLTTNKPVSESGKVLHNDDLASAILDWVLKRGLSFTSMGPRAGHVTRT